MKQIIVTISRQLGSGGAFIGQEVARSLGLRYVDREILGEAAKMLKEDPTVLARREERVSSFMENFFNAMALGSPDTGYIPPPFRLIYDQQIFNAEAAIIRQVAETESAVIVGRGAYHVLKGHPGLLNIFLHAPKELRHKRLMAIYKLDNPADADAMIQDSDNSRKKFIEKVTKASWSDALNFHLCIDTGKTGLSVAVKTISKIVMRMQEGNTGTVR